MLTDTLFQSSLLAISWVAILGIVVIIWFKYGKVKKNNTTTGIKDKTNAVVAQDRQDATAVQTEDVVEAVDEFMNEATEEANDDATEEAEMTEVWGETVAEYEATTKKEYATPEIEEVTPEEDITDVMSDVDDVEDEE